MVYNFALPPLVLHTFYTQDATAISKWAKDLKIDSRAATFFNILDTHDGVGVMVVKGILSKEQIDFLIRKAKEHGAYISYKVTEDKVEEPYEINTTWWSAINRADSNEEVVFQVKRYIASRSILLVLKGVPGLYTHGLFALPNDYELVKATNVRRDVNRGIIDSEVLSEALVDPDSKRSRLIRISRKIHLNRTRNRAFHPQGDQRVLMTSPDVFVVLRVSPEGDQHILTMTNVTDKASSIEIPLSDLGLKEMQWRDLITEKEWTAEGDQLSITMQSYDVIWLMPVGE